MLLKFQPLRGALQGARLPVFGSTKREKIRDLSASIPGAVVLALGCLSLLNSWFGVPLHSADTLSVWMLQMPVRRAALFCIMGLSLCFAAAHARRVSSKGAQCTVGASTRLLVTLILLTLFIGVNINLSIALNECTKSRVLITRTHGIANAFRDTVAALRTVESGQRGYLLTGQASYLNAYQEGLGRLARAQRNRFLQVQEWSDAITLNRLARQKVSELNETVRLREAGHYEEARDLVRSGRGLALMEQIEASDARLQFGFNSLLAEQNAAYRQAVEMVRRSILASYALAFGLLTWAGLFFHQEIARRTSVERRLRAQEVELASRIEERTAALGASEARYRAMLDQSPVAIHVLDRKGNSLHVNPAFERMVGVPAEHMNGYNILADPQPAVQGTLDLLKTVFAGGTMVTQAVRHVPELSTRTPLDSGGAKVAWAEVVGYPVKDLSGEVQEVVLLCQDVTDRELALISVRENELRFRQLANVMPQIVWTAKPDGIVDYFNERWYSFTDSTPETLLEWEKVIHPDDLPGCLETWGESIVAQTHFSIEQRLWDRKRGEYRWHLARAVPILDDNNAVAHWFGTTTDIHEQKEVEEILEERVSARTAELQRSYDLLQIREEELRRSLGERDVLLREVHHRVKNNLQVISSLLRMQGDSLKAEPAASMALEESRRRVLSMAMIHERLYANARVADVDFAEYTQTLVRELIFSYSLPGRLVESRIRVGQVRLNVDQAIPCGLILNELVTNALKYAFAGRQHGEIHVDLLKAPSGIISLAVSDNGVGLPHGFHWNTSDSLGLPIVDILARQLDGAVEYEFRSGARFTVAFPDKTK